MSLTLCEKTIITNDNIRLIDIMPDELEEQQSIVIESPTFTEIAGTYKIWKYSAYGYIFKKITHDSSISYLYYDDDVRSTRPDHSIRRYILRNDPAIFGIDCVTVAKSHYYVRNNQEIERWTVQDPVTLQWNQINNIRITKNII